MKHFSIGILVATALFAGSPSYSQEDLNSGSAYLKNCSIFVDDNQVGSKFQSGLCAGALTMLIYHFDLYGICAPQNGTIQQTARVVVKYLSDKPEELHEPFPKLAVDGLRKAWPCHGKR